MRPLFKHCWTGTRLCTAGVCRLLRWSLWLALGLLLLLQLWIASAHELPVPPPVLRWLEHHLAHDSLAVHLGRAALDPAGRLLVENLTLSSREFSDPLLQIRLVYVRLDPWALVQGQSLLHQIEVSGLELSLPAPLSPTGCTEPLLRDLAFDLHPDATTLTIDQFAGQCGGIAVTAHGAINLTAWRRQSARPAGDWYPTYLRGLRQIARWYPSLQALQGGKLTLELTSTPQTGAEVQATLYADGLKLAQPWPVELGPVHLQTRFPLALAATPTVFSGELELASLTFPQGTARDLQLQGELCWQPRAGRIQWQTATLSATHVAAFGATARVPRLTLQSFAPHQVHAELLAEVADAPLTATGDFDWEQRQGTYTFATALTNGLIAIGSQRTGRDLSRFLLLQGPARWEGRGQLNPGGKPAWVRGWLEAGRALAYHVPVDRATGWLELRGQQFTADDARLRISDSEARGSYTMNFGTRDFRFLLAGQLQPMDINGWFKGWWGNFWPNFDFSSVVPRGDVDISGRWGNVPLTQVFVGAEGERASIRGVPFTLVRTQLFIRPDFIHALHFTGTRDEGAATGWFSRRTEPGAHDWRAIDFAVQSSVDLAAAAQLYGPAATAYLAPFRFAQAPHVQASGHLDGPTAPHGLRQQVRAELQTAGEVSLLGLPVQGLNLAATYDTGNYRCERFQAGFAGGTAQGQAQWQGHAEPRRLGFDLTLTRVDLGRTANELQTLAARLQGRPVPPPRPENAWMTGVQTDLSLSAEGPWTDVRAFHGDGNVLLAGANLAHVRLLGDLSVLIPFSSLHFTTARANFKIAGPQIEFPEVHLSGSNSAIAAHGTYRFEGQTLDFKAKVYPFVESGDGLRGAMSLVLLPFTQVLEVQLDGTLADPAWRFLYSPTNLLHSLTKPVTPDDPTATPPPTAPGPLRTMSHRP